MCCSSEINGDNLAVISRVPNKSGDQQMCFVDCQTGKRGGDVNSENNGLYSLWMAIQNAPREEAGREREKYRTREYTYANWRYWTRSKVTSSAKNWCPTRAIVFSFSILPPFTSTISFHIEKKVVSAITFPLDILWHFFFALTFNTEMSSLSPFDQVSDDSAR